MKRRSSLMAIAVGPLLLLQPELQSLACGPSEIEALFVFRESPDVPFTEYTAGKIGIVQPTFGKKTLVIAYRYLNGNAFTSEEQLALREALTGRAPEDEGDGAVKAWVLARKKVLNDEQTKEIYTEGRYGGYDFFPNCTKNAFEMATQTLQDRAATYGSDNEHVREWLTGQDAVFHSCSNPSTIPPELSADKPEWLRKDREYQIAAALFYSLKFDDARLRFDAIARDPHSTWHELAEYLVGRVLVRQASLSQDAAISGELYKRAEDYLNRIVDSGGEFSSASRKLLGIVKYRTHPEQRVRELARNLSVINSSADVRQDLIDYVWLLDKFEAKILQADDEPRDEYVPPPISPDQTARFEARERGELIHVNLYLPPTASQPGSGGLGLAQDFKPDTPLADIVREFERVLNRDLTADEVNRVKESYESALEYRDWRRSPNRQFPRYEYEGTPYSDKKVAPEAVPEFLRSDDLTDWIFTTQAPDAQAYAHALQTWQQTESHAWLATALMKANARSPRLARLLHAASGIDTTSAAWPTVIYHRIRLHAEMGRRTEGQVLLDEVLPQLSLMPISAQNQFTEQRMQLGLNLEAFLQSAFRKPVAFYDEGRIASLTDLLTPRASETEPTTSDTADEQNVHLYEATLLPWADRRMFDETATEMMNTHFPLSQLVLAANSHSLPDYLRVQMKLAVWTRAVVLKNDKAARRIAGEIVRDSPDLADTFLPYLHAQSSDQRHYAAIFILLKNSNLSPFLKSGLPYVIDDYRRANYYFETAWWCPPATTEYLADGVTVPKVVKKPAFLSAQQLAEAKREYALLLAVGDAKSYLGRQAIVWAETNPGDPRMPEALFIAAMANWQYKYGCDGWSFDRQTKERAEKILRERYTDSVWTVMLNERTSERE